MGFFSVLMTDDLRFYVNFDLSLTFFKFRCISTILYCQRCWIMFGIVSLFDNCKLFDSAFNYLKNIIYYYYYLFGIFFSYCIVYKYSYKFIRLTFIMKS